MSEFKRSEFKNIVFITLGSAILACGVAFFLLPAEIATGGTPGMAMLVHFLTDISTGVAMLLINIPLLAIGIRFIDLKFAIRTIYSMLVTALSVDLLVSQVDFPTINSLLLSTLYGGTCIGAGVGLVLKGHASAGGTTIIAKIVSSYSHIKPAQVVLILDALIIIAIGFIFADMERVLWSMLSIYATTQVIDKILTGAVPEKIVHIVSEKADRIGLDITEQLGRDGTILSGQNLTGEQSKNILFVVVGARRIPTLRNIVLGIDPKALMLVMEASEMSGSSRRVN
ncbi:YitT family protein [Aliikangiella coralliicola]|uniref:YitT family protein n=1 Tax=Aliikangiella coralliicola TaxID=2592383 RepID=A0A545UJG6_9GAMM|nr:YitT family protein [Aliikangiella coralliicola]TQV89606.1 YitT family protein [Aliikangiella coralliicola]